MNAHAQQNRPIQPHVTRRYLAVMLNVGFPLDDQTLPSEPGRDRAGRELAGRLGIRPRNMLTQLAEWARPGLLAKTGPGRYALAAGSPGP